MELRRWLSRELSAGGSIDVGAEAPVRRVRQLTDGQGAGAVLDTTPDAAQAVAQAVHMVRDGGTVVASGLEGWRPFFELSSDDLV